MQGKAKGELWGTLKALGGLEHPKRHPEGSWDTHTWRVLGCRESQMLGSVALQKKHVEGSGAVRKENAGLGYAAKGRWRLPGCTESHLCSTQGLHPPRRTPGGLSSLGTPGAGLRPRGSRQPHKQRNPDESRGEKQQPLPHSWPSHTSEAFPSASACTKASGSGAAGAKPAAGGDHGSSFPVPISFPVYGNSAPVTAGGLFQRFRFSCLISAKAVCALWQLPSYGIARRIQTSKNDTNPPPAQSGGEAGSCQPFPQVFASG